MPARFSRCELLFDFMSVYRKLLSRILSGNSDANISFDDLLKVMRHLDFECRIRGSHHIFHRADVPEILNFQPKGNQAKPYQIKQLREVLTKNHLINEDDT